MSGTYVDYTGEYVIVARVRGFKRWSITLPMSKKEAEAWKPTPTLKKAYKYFRVVKYKKPKQ